MQSELEARRQFAAYYTDLKADADRGGYRVSKTEEWERFVAAGLENGDYPATAKDWRCPRSFKTIPVDVIRGKSTAPKPKKMAVSFRPTYYFEDGTTVQFVPTQGVHGFTHKVVVTGPGTNNQPVRDWLGDNAKPNEKAARYFHEKHGGGK